MHRMILVLTIFVSQASGWAQVRQFPYKARVVTEEAYARSGAGDAYYPTQLLHKEAIVNVRRHDPGGWYMIDPPEGSFSFIPQKYVRQTGAGKGEVLDSNVVVFVGSEFGEESSVWQRKLMSGDTVTILGQQTVDTLSGQKAMFRIAPPRREYRWVRGTALIPVGEAQRSQFDRDPYAVPSNIVQRSTEPDARVNLKPRSTSAYSPSQRLVRLQTIRTEQRQLKVIDQEFRTMLLSPPSEWKLDEIERQYRDLQDSATHKPLAGQIDLRYPAIRRYRQRKAKLDELKQLTSATEQMDARLMAQQYGLPTNNVSQQAMGPTDPLPFSAFSPTEPLPNYVPDGTMLPQFQSSSSFVPEAAGSPGAPPALTVPPRSRYIGAGYVTRGTAGESPFLLTTASGKVLAHLASDSVDLDSRVGRAVGLHGRRFYDDKVKADRIEVSGLEEVRLK